MTGTRYGAEPGIVTVVLSVPYQNPAGVSPAAALTAPTKASGTARAQAPSNPPARRRQRPGLRGIATRLSVCTPPVWQSRPVHTSLSQTRRPADDSCAAPGGGERPLGPGTPAGKSPPGRSVMMVP